MAVPLFIYFGALNGLQGAFWECLFLYLLVLNQRLEVKEDQTEIFYSTGNCLFVLRLESEPRFSGVLLVCVWGESLDFFSSSFRESFARCSPFLGNRGSAQDSQLGLIDQISN